MCYVNYLRQTPSNHRISASILQIISPVYRKLCLCMSISTIKPLTPSCMTYGVTPHLSSVRRIAIASVISAHCFNQIPVFTFHTKSRDSQYNLYSILSHI